MIRKFIKPFINNNSLFKNSLFNFSINPTPTPNPQNNNQNPKQSFNDQNIKQNDLNQSQSQTLTKRAQARIKVCRAELAKFSKAQLDYQKMNSPTKQQQLVLKYFKHKNIKIKYHNELGPRLQFHLVQQTAKKRIKEQKQTSKQDQKNKQKDQQFLQELEQQQEQDMKLQMKIFTTATKQLSNSQNSFFDQYFTKLQQIRQADKQGFQINFKVQFGNDKSKTPRTGFSNFNNSKSNPKQSVSISNFMNKNPFKIVETAQQQDSDTIQEKFKQFTVYLRNSVNKSQNPNIPQKWAKFEILVERWFNVHIYKISIVDNIQNEIKGLSQSPKQSKRHKFQGIQAKQLDQGLLSQLKINLQSLQQIQFQLLAAVYFYTGLYEHQYYKKWLQDLVDICK